jgi:hypothetical protein
MSAYPKTHYSFWLRSEAEAAAEQNMIHENALMGAPTIVRS